MQKELFEEMAQKVIDKLDEKIQSPSYNKDLQITIDSNKINSHLMKFAKDNEDFFSKWFEKEVNQINNDNDVYRIHLISAISAYLAFLSQFPPPPEIQDLKPFEIFFKVYTSALKIKNLNLLVRLKNI